jgi:uncharacterized membrane protein (DUF485 family)
MKPTKKADLDLENGMAEYSNNKEPKEISNIKKKMQAFSISVPLLVFVWYSAAVISIITSKKLLNSIKMPHVLCTVQVNRFC